MKPYRAALAILCLTVSCSPGGRPVPEPEIPVMPDEVIQRFETECARLLEAHPGGVPSYCLARENWCYQMSELRYGATGPFFGEAAQTFFPDAPPEEADPLGAVLDFRDQLEARGIDLIFVPIPVRPLIYPEGVIDLGEFVDADPLPDLKPMQNRFLGIVGNAGVLTVDLTSLFLRNRRYVGGPLYCKSDTHWTPSGATLAAMSIGRLLKSRPWYEHTVDELDDPTAKFSMRWSNRRHFGHCYKKLRDLGGVENLSEEELSVREIIGPGSLRSGRKTLRHPDSPVVVLGDSNMLWWQQMNAAFPQQLAFELGYWVDTLTTHGGGINEARLNLARTLREDPEYLDGKRAVIWIFTARSMINAKPYWLRIPLPR